MTISNRRYHRRSRSGGRIIGSPRFRNDLLIGKQEAGKTLTGVRSQARIFELEITVESVVDSSWELTEECVVERAPAKKLQEDWRTWYVITGHLRQR